MHYAVYQTNINETQKLLLEAHTECEVAIALNIAQQEAIKKIWHPTTRQKYYTICQILESHGVISSYKLKPMPTPEKMLQQHRKFHAPADTSVIDKDCFCY